MDRAVALDRHYIHIHADPNARGFYEKMTAKLIGFALYVVQGIAREVPIMKFRCPEVYPRINAESVKPSDQVSEPPPRYAASRTNVVW